MSLRPTVAPRNTGVVLGKVVRVTAEGPYVELPRIARGFQIGPLVTVVDPLVKGDRVVVAPLAHDSDTYVVIGRIV